MTSTTLRLVGIVSMLLIAAVAISYAAQRDRTLELDLEPAVPNSTTATQALLQELAHLSANSNAGILSGQNVGHATANLQLSFRQTWVKLNAYRELPTPSVMGIDLGLGNFPRDARFSVQLLAEHAAAGGIVTISMHPPNPWTGKGAYDLTNVSAFDVLRPGTKARQHWHDSLNQAAAVLEALAKRNIVVVWRPLHEANGDWFWWCYGKGKAKLKPDEFRLLWQDMFRYLTQVRGLKNLLWVYASNAETYGDIRSLTAGYPGDEFVDIVALDYYGDDLDDLNRNGCYDKAIQLGKPLALSEFGSKPMDGTMDGTQWMRAIRTKYPHFAYFMFWHSWTRHDAALADLNDTDKVLRNDFVINLEQLTARRAVSSYVRQNVEIAGKRVRRLATAATD